MFRSLIVVAVVLTPVSALAEEVDLRRPTANMLEAGLFSGAFIPSRDHELFDSTRSFQSPLSPLGVSLSLRASYFPLSWLGAEVEGGFVPQKNERAEPVQLFTARGHAVLQVPWMVTPFAVAGGGWLGASSESGHDVDRALHWGGGLKLYPVDWMSVRVDARQIWTAGRGPGAGNTSHFELLGGISFTLWRDEVAPAPPPVIFSEAPEQAAEPEPELDAPAIVEANRGFAMPSTPAQAVAYHLRRVHFPFGSARIVSAAYPALDLTAQILEAHTDLYVHVSGHADAIGSDRFNLRLSRRRAQAVVDYLIGAGISADRLRVRAFGERAPAEPNDTAYGRAINRRCDIRVFDAQGTPLASTTAF